MGSNANEFTSLATYGVTYKIFNASPGDLVGITLYSTDDFVDPAEAYAEFGIGSNIEDRNSRSIILAGGNCGSYKSLFYEGHFPLERDDYICVMMQSLFAKRWRINYKIISEARKELRLAKQ